MNKTIKVIILLIISFFTISCASLQTEKKSDSIPNTIEQIDSSLPFYQKLQGHLYNVNGNKLEDELIEQDYYFLFYGADWCPYCKKRRKYLVNFYTEFKSKYNNFELILVGSQKDTGNEDLLKYMKNEAFPFYYLDFNYRDQVGVFNFNAITDCEKFYIPAVILLDKNGEVISSSNKTTKNDYKFDRPFEEYIIFSKKINYE